MQAKLEKQEKALTLEVEEEDISLAHIVRGELIKNPDTLFAGVVKPHPLLKRFIIELHTKRKDPVETLVDGGKKAADLSKELAKAVEESLSARV